MSDTTLRHLAMLSAIPGRPGKVSARQLHETLKQQGFKTHVRSVERDLHKLATIFPLINDDAHPAGWAWQKNGSHLSFPALSLNAALTFRLLEQYLKPLLPRAMLDDVQPQFDLARRVLDDLGASPIGQWSRKIAAIAPGQPLLPPKIDDRIRDIVYESVFGGRQIVADYRARDARKARTHTFNPLGLVYREGVLYLVATLHDRTDILQFALHRMSRAELLAEPARTPKGFSLDQYVREQRAFDYPLEKRVRLELIADDWLASFLAESRLSADQKITPLHNTGEARVVATVMETQQLEWWLRSLGVHVEVVKPIGLRERMRAGAREVARKHAPRQR